MLFRSAKISSRPGQSGRCDGYVLEGKELDFYIKKMQKKERQPKPLIECEVPIVLHKEGRLRARHTEVPGEVREQRVLQMKDWARFTNRRNRDEIWHLDKVLISQAKALEELKHESEPLYNAAVQFDPDLLDIELRGPCVTPPIEKYLQDGEYKDVTQSYKVIYEDTETFMKSLLMRKRTKKKKQEDDD